MQELTALSAKKLAELIKERKVSCVEVMQAYLNRINQVNKKINAIIEPLPTEQALALAQAQAADKMLANHSSLGKLHGVPITIKQGRKVKGFMCNLGNKSPANFIAQEDATVVARLRAAGTIIIGITNIPDFSMSYETDNLLYGCTHNPYHLNHSPGGSSGGEASAIAAGCSAFGIGADSGGSIRQPAHNCGIVGLKPTRGLIPITGKFPDDALGIFSYIETQGPMARYVEDIIYTLPILIGPDGQDANTCPINLRNPEQVDLKSLRIKFYTANGVASVSAEIDSAIRKIVEQFANITEAYPIISKETYTEFEELFFYGGDKGQWLIDRMNKMRVEQVAPPFQAILDRAKLCEFSVTELRRRLLAIDKFKLTMMEFMRDADVIICPVATNTAGLYNGERMVTQLKPKLDLAYDLTYNLPYNIMGWPAVVVRCGTGNDSLPIGLQVIAKSWREDIALAVAKVLEEISGGWQMPNC